MAKKHNLKRQQASKPDVEGQLELSHQKFKTILINIQRVIIDYIENMQEQMGNISRKVKTLRKNQKEMLGIKNIVTKTKNVFD